MPYARSAARRDFEGQVALLKRTLGTCRPGGSLRADVRDSVISYTVLLTSAYLETYLDSVISAWLQRCVTSGVTFSKLPNTLRSFCFLDDRILEPFRHYCLTGDEFMFGQRILDGADANAFAAVDRGGQVAVLPIRRILRKKYPSPENLKLTFKRIGVPNVFDSLSARLRADSEAILTSFNDARSAIAHEGVPPPGFSDRDALRHLENVKVMVKWLDHVLWSHVREKTGVTSWPR